MNPAEYQKAHDKRLRELVEELRKDQTLDATARWNKAREMVEKELPTSLRRPYTPEELKDLDQQAHFNNGPSIVWMWEPGRRR